MARQLYPIKDNIQDLFPDGNYATVEQLTELASVVSSLAEQLNQANEALEAYKEQIRNGVQTTTLDASNIRATYANISGALSALEANITDIDCATIDVSDVANIERLVAQAAQIAGTLDADAITSSDINSANIEASVATIGRLIATTAEIDNWVVGIMTANRVDAVLGNITTVNSETVNTEDLNVTDTLVADKLQTRDFEVTTADIAGAKIGNISTSRITWKDYQTVIDADDFYIEIPHFNNGMYCLRCLSDNNIVFSIEIFNSIDNYFVRWSQATQGWLQNIYSVGSDNTARLYFKCHNMDNGSLTLRFGYICDTDAGSPSTYDTMPVVPQANYEVVYQNGSKFFKNVDLAQSGSSAGTITKVVTDNRNLATQSYVYDGTNNVLNRDYLPDQSLNTDDSVHFHEVVSPFLGVTDLSVSKEFNGPHIYDGASLSNAQLLQRKSDNIYISSDTTTGNTSAAVRLQKIDNNGDFTNETSVDFSASVANAYDNKTFERYGPYSAADGYTIDTSSPVIVASSKTITGYNTSQAHVVTDQFGNDYFIALTTGGGIQVQGLMGTFVLGNDGTLSATEILKGVIYEDSTMSEPLYSVGKTVGTTFYLWDEVRMTGSTLTIKIPMVGLQSVASLPYTLSNGENAKINRLRINNGAAYVSPIVPYDEVSTVADPVDDTHPLVYDTTTDTIKKSTGDITVEGDLAVVGDTTFGGDVTVSGSLNINDETVLDTFHVRGDSFLDGEVVASDDVHIKGDLIVDGKTYTTEEESIETSSNYAVLRKNNPSPLGANEKSGIVVHNYATNKNAFIGVDRDGTFRISDNAAEQTTTYTDVLYYNGTYTPSVSISGAITAQDMDQFDEVVLDNGTYYHWNNSKWFELVYDSVADAYSYDYTDPVTDATLIAALDLLTKADFAYFRSLSVMTVNDATNQPLLTRAEETDLQNNDILVWDETNKKAVNAVRPVQSNTVLTAKVSSGATVHWAGITFTATGMASMLYKFPETDDTVFMDLELQPINKPTVPSGASDVVHTYNDFLYYTETDKIVSYDSVADKYYEVFFNADGTCTVDQYPTIIGDPTKLKACTITSEKIDNDHGVTYEWKSGGSGSVSRFATMAEAQAAIAIPEGQDGYIPNNGIIIIDELNSYVTGEDR